MALATVDEQGTPWVRTIDAIFDGDSFYTVTYSLSNKMKLTDGTVFSDGVRYDF